jgi:hypothetical protein
VVEKLDTQPPLVVQANSGLEAELSRYPLKQQAANKDIATSIC